MPTKPAKRALAEYARKRDFTKTSEPKGKPVRRAVAKRQLRFCIQKHLASHLHYDFRLEHEGVLLSWAIPKGPSLDSTVKRLAMKVEDHPLEYGKFEGVIPEGYGAGIVMLWDQGTWRPEVENVGEALEKGNLKFTVEGIKLKGSWVLVRSGGRGRNGDDRQWLLIKHRDEWSGELDITEAAPLSVKSFGDFAEILADAKPKIWKTYKPQQGGEAGRLMKEVVAKAVELRTAKAGRSRSLN
ncbi:MAG TPA: DNA polymerase ligase N-terminal domain-containing protein [Tepidisphaeraceae bacterium]|jgi:bifunctional non-homologous end joining protein LigD|nr:DNA polymerase ligase N-terminal domain-containing protein [Tepidisphaeraceae bacterium]